MSVLGCTRLGVVDVRAFPFGELLDGTFTIIVMFSLSSMSTGTWRIPPTPSSSIQLNSVARSLVKELEEVDQLIGFGIEECIRIQQHCGSLIVLNALTGRKVDNVVRKNLSRVKGKWNLLLSHDGFFSFVGHSDSET